MEKISYLLLRYIASQQKVKLVHYITFWINLQQQIDFNKFCNLATVDLNTVNEHVTI